MIQEFKSLNFRKINQDLVDEIVKLCPCDYHRKKTAKDENDDSQALKKKQGEVDAANKALIVKEKLR